MTLARNAFLAGLAALALAAGLAGESTSAVAWLGGLNGIQLAVLTLGCVVAALTAAVTLAFLSLLRSYGTALLRLDTIERRLAQAGIELEEGESAARARPRAGHDRAGVRVADANGELVSVDDLLAPGLPLLLLFTSPSCDPCQALLPDIAVWQTEHADRMTIAVAHGGDRDTGLAEAQEHDLERVLVDHDLSLQEAYGAGATPTGVLVAPDGTIASWVAPGADWIERLGRGALAGGNETACRSARPPPSWRSSGSTVSRSRSSILTARRCSSSGTPPAGSVAPCTSACSLRSGWQTTDAPRLVIVSSGDEISTAAEGFISSVALDPEFSAGEAFGAGGTPMAVLLDGRAGRVAPGRGSGSSVRTRRWLRSR